MASLGRAAANVAHELNSPLGAIVAYSNLVLESTPADSPGRANLEKVVREAARCQDIVRGLLDFARTEPGSRQAADLLVTSYSYVYVLNTHFTDFSTRSKVSK